LWIDAGADPLPRKLVIAYKTEDEVPQYAVTIRKWNVKATLPDALFRFTPPDGATRVEVTAFGPAGRTATPSAGAAGDAPGATQEN
jgi:hypothetical protein